VKAGVRNNMKILGLSDGTTYGIVNFPTRGVNVK